MSPPRGRIRKPLGHVGIEKALGRRFIANPGESPRLERVRLKHTGDDRRFTADLFRISPIVYAKTHDGQPGVPKLFKVTHRAEDIVLLEAQVPEHERSRITSYNGAYTIENG